MHQNVKDFRCNYHALFYSQNIICGLFTARINVSDGGSFSKVEGGPKPMNTFSSPIVKGGSGVARNLKKEGGSINSTFFVERFFFFFSAELI